MAQIVALLVCALLSSSHETFNESLTPVNVSATYEEVTLDTSQPSTVSSGYRPEVGSDTTHVTRPPGPVHTKGMSTLRESQTTPTPQYVSLAEQPTTSTSSYPKATDSGSDMVTDDSHNADQVGESTTSESYMYTDVNKTTDTMVAGNGVWMIAFDNVQLVLSVVGYIANKMTFITLVRHGHMFSPAIRLLLKHQALADSWICAMGTILLLQPPMWTTGNEYFDAAVCYLWHGQAPFWGAILLSVWTLAAIAVERYMAVCHPFKHAQIQGSLAVYSIVAMYIANVIVIWPAFGQVRFENGVCLSEYVIPGPLGEQLYLAYCVVWFFAVYLIPVTAYVYLYGSVVLTLYRRSTTSTCSSKAIDSAQTTITKTAITLTGIFLFAIGYDAWAYLLGYTGVTEYKFGSTKQKVGVFFSVFNSVINPFVYLALMPSFRVSLRKTFLCCVEENVKINSSAERSDTSKAELSKI